VVRTREPEAAAATLRRLGLRDIRLDGGKVRATPPARRDDGGDAASAVTPEQMVYALVGAGVPVRGFELRTPSLEDLFVELTGEGFDVSG
jgi:ABC-2 type transport system ATP-binding protein